tara:strand:- start:15471 stop:17117 length:1647 start_codon:yes stop_codon:yes gene_type:complete
VFTPLTGYVNLNCGSLYISIFSLQEKKLIIDSGKSTNNTDIILYTSYFSQMTKFSFYDVVWVRTNEFNMKIPLILLSGDIALGVNQWLLRYVRSGSSATTISNAIRAIGHLYDFWITRELSEGSEYEVKNLLAEFIDAKRYGTGKHCIAAKSHFLHNIMLDWKPVKPANIKATYLNYINDFDKWQSIVHGAEKMNPSEKRFLNSYEKYLDEKQRRSWDMFLHLDKARSKTKEVYKNEAAPRSIVKANRLKNKAAKCFPPDKFIELIESCKNPRDKLLFLLYGAGSLRSCEPLQFFLTDVGGKDVQGQLKVHLTDPELGDYKWEKDGKFVTTTRTEYIVTNYKNEYLPSGHPLKNLVPRSSILDINDSQHAGYKGMSFGATDIKNNKTDMGIYWCSVDIGRYAATVFKEYCDTYIYNNPFTNNANPSLWPHHPWLFINISKEHYGLPLSVTSLKGIWKRACARIGLSGYGIHSLRHLFGFYCANVNKLDIGDLSIMLHHSNPSSTSVYYHLSDPQLRIKLAESQGINLAVLGIKADFQYQIPQSWKCFR